MTLDQRPPSVSLRRKLALATKGARLALANGFARLLGLTLQAHEATAAGGRDLGLRPATTPRGAPTPELKQSPAPPPQPAVATPAPEAPRPDAPPRPPKFTAVLIAGSDDCAICGDPLEQLVGVDGCPNCKSPARLRSLPPLLDDLIGPAARAAGVTGLPLLGFAMTGVEDQLVGKVFPRLKSASLFGSYGKDHETGVDARAMPQYADGSFGAHFSILLFDYFTEHAEAIAEAYRVLAPGGVFFTHTAPFRLLDGWEAPHQVKEVRGRPGYFEYLPDGVALADIRVGRQWFTQAMEDAGFKAQWVQIHDRAAGQSQDWFVGYKPRL